MLIRTIAKVRSYRGLVPLARRFLLAGRGPRFVYALTPPARLANIGDQAQVVAIKAWFASHHPGIPVVEVDKDEITQFGPALRRLVRRGDVIVLHSGGNLGDRGMWSERGRRFMISSFHDNKVVSLPQTIFFSDTEKGRSERAITEQVYAGHPDLTVYGRDEVSGALAEQLFPSARTGVAPDFVLSLPADPGRPSTGSENLLLCLRLDDESALTEQERTALAGSDWNTTVFDTTLSDPIDKASRERIVNETRDLFRRNDVVITDRYHGLIFAVLSARPCIVLRTVDHKLTSAMGWFEKVEFVQFADSPSDALAMLETMRTCDNFDRPDWDTLYFDELADTLMF